MALAGVFISIWLPLCPPMWITAFTAFGNLQIKWSNKLSHRSNFPRSYPNYIIFQLGFIPRTLVSPANAKSLGASTLLSLPSLRNNFIPLTDTTPFCFKNWKPNTITPKPKAGKTHRRNHANFDVINWLHSLWQRDYQRIIGFTTWKPDDEYLIYWLAATNKAGLTLRGFESTCEVSREEFLRSTQRGFAQSCAVRIGKISPNCLDDTDKRMDGPKGIYLERKGKLEKSNVHPLE